MVWLKAHEDELVFAAARSRQHLLTSWPADAERVSIREPGGTELAGLVFHADGGADAFWVLHLPGNADSAFSPWQVRHCEALRGSGFNVLEIDYRGFGATPGQPSEAAMNDDAEAAYQALLQRGVAADRYPYLPVPNEPKQLVSLDGPVHDGFGGHVDALYEHVDVLQAALAGLVPTITAPHQL